MQLFKLFMIYKLLTILCLKSCSHVDHVVSLCISLPVLSLFRAKFSKSIKGPFYLSTTPNLHQTYSCSVLFWLANIEKDGFGCEARGGKKKKVKSCDVGMAGFFPHLVASEMKVSNCASIK